MALERRIMTSIPAISSRGSVIPQIPHLRNAWRILKTQSKTRSNEYCLHESCKKTSKETKMDSRFWLAAGFDWLLVVVVCGCVVPCEIRSCDGTCCRCSQWSGWRLRQRSLSLADSLFFPLALSPLLRQFDAIPDLWSPNWFDPKFLPQALLG